MWKQVSNLGFLEKNLHSNFCLHKYVCRKIRISAFVFKKYAQ